MRIQKQLQKGFILFITLMMLIIFAILGIGLYQQTTMSTMNVQYVTFKQEAEDLAMIALNELEANLTVKDGDGKSKYAMRARCGEFELDADGKPKPDPDNEGKFLLANKVELCDPISDDIINQALVELREQEGLTGGTANIAGWDNLIEQGYKGKFSGDGSVYYIIQQLDESPEKDGFLYFRITIIARVLDAYSAISAVSAVPK